MLLFFEKNFVDTKNSYIFASEMIKGTPKGSLNLIKNANF